MISYKYILLILLFIFGCIQPQMDKKNQRHETFTIIDTTFTTRITVADTTEIDELGDSLIIKGVCAVYYGPDSVKITKMQKEFSEEDYLIIIDDYSWYLAKSREFLEIQGVKIINTDKKQIVFIENNGQRTTFNTDTLYWGVFIFNGIDEPIQASMVDIEDDYKKYFKGK